MERRGRTEILERNKEQAFVLQNLKFFKTIRNCTLHDDDGRKRKTVFSLPEFLMK
jgi:hypothetical protein